MSDIQEQIKLAHKRAEENDVKLRKEDMNYLAHRIDKAITYMEMMQQNGIADFTDIENLLNILKGNEESK